MSVSIDLFTGLQYFYNNYPEFLDNDLYVSGESFAGVYVPYLSW